MGRYMMQHALLKNHTPGKEHSFAALDIWLLCTIILLIGLGLVAVASSSAAIADRNFSQPLYYFWRQFSSSIIGLSVAIILLKTPVSLWHSVRIPLMIIGLLLLLLVLLPWLGKTINGSRRWISIGAFSLQPSELIKVCFVIYLAGYITTHRQKIRNSLWGGLKPIFILAMIAVLLLLEPDYGSCVVLFITTLGMLFMGGLPIFRCLTWSLVAVATLLSLAILSPYRIERLMSFTDPWQDHLGSGFQLTQALIAFGRGDWFGVGLGNSIQKLFYLPEAHTDFLFSVFAEEFGFFGTSLLICLFGFLIWRTFKIGYVAEKLGKFFGAYLAYGIGLIISVQALINMGVNLGVLPTKGLPLPLISYGNNNMVFTCLLLSILLRIDIENRQSAHMTNVKHYAK